MMHTEIHSDAVGRVACARLWDSAIGETAGASDPPYGKWLPIANSPGNGMDIGCILPGVLSKNRKNFVIGEEPMTASLNLICAASAAKALVDAVSSDLEHRFSAEHISCESEPYWKDTALVQTEVRFEAQAQPEAAWAQWFTQRFGAGATHRDEQFTEFLCSATIPELTADPARVFADLYVPHAMAF